MDSVMLEKLREQGCTEEEAERLLPFVRGLYRALNGVPTKERDDIVACVREQDGIYRTPDALLE
jgi:hypothetical protein